MTNGIFNSLLVPVDFSKASREAFRQSLRLVGGDDPELLVLHVIDEELLELMMTTNEYGDRETLTSNFRKHVEEKLTDFLETENTTIQINKIVTVGIPFLEIIRKSKDFAVDAIVMGKVGAGDRFEKLLFGSTAERVLRGSMRPVIVFPGPCEST